MSRIFHRVRRKVAAAPGTIEYSGPIRQEKPCIELFDYNEDTFDERDVDTIEEAFPLRDSGNVSWINIDGLHDNELMSKLGDHFGLHPLVMEDIVNTHQRPKVEEYEDYVFVVARMIYFEEDGLNIRSEQMSFVLSDQWLLSFQEVHGDVFANLRDRIRAGRGRIRRLGPDYLLYALIDALVDHHFVILDKLGERIEDLEEEVNDGPDQETLRQIHAMRREMILLRKSVWPMREVLASMMRTESELITEDIELFLRDVYDHSIQIIDAVESFRDMLTSIQDLYMSNISNRMNEVMKVLTIAATIFVPLTFIAGVYGMNFEHMPELGWKWSYLVFWIITLGLGGGMIAIFRRKDWL